jgi:ferric-dicitrate binding protein FerR (iron transport regulator)
MKNNVTHIDQDEIKRLLSRNAAEQSFTENEAELLETAVNACDDYFAAQHVDMLSAWEKINSRVGEPKASTVNAKRFHINRYVWIPAAAAALALLLLLPVFRTNHTQIIKDEKLVSENTSTERQIILPDGTSVTLNRNAKLVYSKQFAANDTRQVELSGEAFFEVKHDASHPFIITAAGAKVKVLGTSFNVKTFENEKRIEVVVSTGKVEVWRPDRSKHIFITPGQMGIATHNADPQLTDADMNRIGWKTQRLVFRNQSLDYIVNNLEQTYHQPIGFSDGSIRDLKLTATFEKQSLEDVLGVIANTHQLRYSKTTSGYLLSR